MLQYAVVMLLLSTWFLEITYIDVPRVTSARIIAVLSHIYYNLFVLE